MYHDSFANRQKYQWRFSFTIWGDSVALAGYAISKGTPEVVGFTIAGVSYHLLDYRSSLRMFDV